MSGAELLAELTRLNIRLKAHSGQLRFHPRSALTPDLLDLVKAHKTELLALLRPKRSVEVTRAAAAIPAKLVCRCGSTMWLDVAIHDGQSTRRDCARCGRFIEFSRWKGIDALQADE